MTESIYRQLARRLDAVPNGFPATESGVEIRLLARLFTPEQARLAAVMRLTPEPSAEIAARAGVPAEEAHRALKGMARLGLIRTETEGRALAFGLLPFVVGFWEAQRPRLDRDLAELMEDYLAETRADPMAAAPGLQRVIPVGRAIHTDVSVFPYERAEALVEGARSWAVGPCICRVQRRLVGQACVAPEEACLWFAPVPNAFRGDGDVRVLTREEALQLLADCEEAGLVHTALNQQEGISYICNCCPCCCGILRGAIEFGRRGALAPSAFRVVVDNEACAACGACLERCHFGALTLGDEGAAVDEGRCVGCGLCASACPQGALRLERREGVDLVPPVDEAAWGALRALSRGISLDGIL